jgi:hypothetical protein
MRSIVRLVIFLLVLLLTVITNAQETIQGISAEEIAKYPEPNVTPLYVQDSVLYDRIYRKVSGSLQLYDAPNGTLMDNLGTGFNYVTLMGAPQGEWAQVKSDRWIRTSEISEDVVMSRYSGVLLPEEGLPYPMAWTLRHINPSSAPGEQDNADNPFMYRYTRVNLYSSVELDGYLWYQVGDNQWIHQFDVAKIAPIERLADVNTNKWVSVDLYEQLLVAYEGTTPVFSTLISSGLPQWSTNEGLFNVYLRRERTLMSGAYNQPDFYYLEEVPWTMFFDGDIALHGTYWHDGFGYRRSHGCVNMSITDSRWLFEWSADVRDFTVENSPDLSVYVYSSGEYN